MGQSDNKIGDSFQLKKDQLGPEKENIIREKLPVVGGLKNFKNRNV